MSKREIDQNPENYHRGKHENSIGNNYIEPQTKPCILM